jgi:hypothetical protein
MTRLENDLKFLFKHYDATVHIEKLRIEYFILEREEDHHRDGYGVVNEKGDIVSIHDDLTNAVMTACAMIGEQHRKAFLDKPRVE